jgi:uncharacterized membrane protein (UPF0182 family)
MSEMPETIKSHIRYPEELMAIQSKIYSTYHMKEPQVFYNKEDMWNIPKEISDTQEEEIKPYYITMSLPEEKGRIYSHDTLYSYEKRQFICLDVCQM